MDIQRYDRDKIVKMKLISNSICYGPCPEPDDEVEQHLSVNEDGLVVFSTYVYGTGKYKKKSTRRFEISRTLAVELLDRIRDYFIEAEQIDVTDVGIWNM